MGKRASRARGDQVSQTQSADMSWWTRSGWQLTPGHLTVCRVDPPAVFEELESATDTEYRHELIDDLIDAVAIERRYSQGAAELTPYREYVKRRLAK